MLHDLGPHGRHRDATICALKHFHAETIFQFLDLSAQRRLRDITTLGRMPKVAFFSDGNDILKIPEVHVRILCVLVLCIAYYIYKNNPLQRYLKLAQDDESTQGTSTRNAIVEGWRALKLDAEAQLSFADLFNSAAP